MKKKILLMTAVAIIGFATITIAQPVPSYVPTSGLVGWWPFTGNANDESGNGNNGTVNGATLTSDRFGNTGKAYNFDGVDDYINCGNNPILQLNNFSISIWSSLDSSSNWSSGVNGGGFFLQKGCDNQLPPNDGFSYRIYYQNPYGLISDNFTSNRVGLDNNLTGLFQNWNHIVFTYNNSQLKLFFNGVIVDSMSRSGTTAVNNETLLIGCRKELIGSLCTLNDYFTGQLDDIGIWNRALTSTEITALFNSSNVGINEVSQSNLFSVYPNPAKSQINLKADAKLLGSVYTIYDNTGKVVLSGKINSENTVIELGNLSGGIYLFSVGENLKQTFKVIKE